ncbi:MAG: S9 family peptidase [Myxococcales bacterium]|nr:S9 family peptidase [Myxococcales bacterium]
MPPPRHERYGFWPSAIDSALVVAQSVRIGRPQLDGEAVYWTELRPSDGGRNVLLRRVGDGAVEDLTPDRFSVRSRVHEYGGGDYLATDGELFFVNDADQRVYRKREGMEPEAITPAGTARYADFVLDRARSRLYAVQELHGDGREALNRLVSISLYGSGVTPLVWGADFYSNPRLSPDGTSLCWLAWHHPNMPWDGTTLLRAEFDDAGALGDPHVVAGGDDESIFQPLFAADGTLYFVSDRRGFWNLYRSNGRGTECVMRADAEFGMPQWVFGMSTYALTPDGTVICAYTRDGVWRLGRLTTDGPLEPIALPYQTLAYVVADAKRAVLLGCAYDRPDALLEVDWTTHRSRVIRESSHLDLDPGYLSTPRHLSLTNREGDTIYAFYYPPSHPDVCGPEGERPPMIVKSHGGPTVAATIALSMKTLFWTSRGFAILDVNYGGSTGYGRSYRRRLDGRWGEIDVHDCIDAAQGVAAMGLADRDRLLITGGSAGGYTTLCALTFHDLFIGGSSHYGVSDPTTLAQETHKFESRYDARLFGATDANAAVYRERSPIHFAERLSCPVIFFQGGEDRVVPPSQAERMVDALREKGVAVEYHLFPNEGHGFRRAENIVTATEAELRFFQSILGRS